MSVIFLCLEVEFCFIDSFKYIHKIFANMAYSLRDRGSRVHVTEQFVVIITQLEVISGSMFSSMLV